MEGSGIPQEGRCQPAAERPTYIDCHSTIQPCVSTKALELNGTMTAGRHGGLIFVSWCCVVAFAVGCKKKPPAPAQTPDAAVMDAGAAVETHVVDAGPKIPSDLNVVLISVDSLRGDMP